MASEETVPIKLRGGPHDGMEVDVRISDQEVRRPSGERLMARYMRVGASLFFVGYCDSDGNMVESGDEYFPPPENGGAAV